MVSESLAVACVLLVRRMPDEGLDLLKTRVIAIACVDAQRRDVKVRRIVRRTGGELTGFPEDRHSSVTVEIFSVWVVQAPLKMAPGAGLRIQIADYDVGPCNLLDFWDDLAPQPLLEGGFDDHRDIALEQAQGSLEENLVNLAIGVLRQLVVIDAEGVYITFLNLIATDLRQP